MGHEARMVCAIMSLRAQIMALVQTPTYTPTDEAGILKALGLQKRQKASVAHEVRKLLAAGELNRVQGDRLRWAGGEGELTGTLIMKGSGRAFVRLVPGQEGSVEDEDVMVGEGHTGTAMHGDTVAIRIAARSHQGSRQRGGHDDGPARIGTVVKVLARARDSMVGTLLRSGRVARLQPDDPRLPVVAILGGLEEAMQGGDKVVVKLAPWTDARSIPTGTVERKLGRQWEPGAELLGVYEKFSLATEFPPPVQHEARGLPSRVGHGELAGRLDYREIPTLTIDPGDAKDFDDALSLEPRENGDLKVGIHIADVSAYVKPGTALDVEARARGNSTYLVGTVVPMLPEKLSNGLCSLVEGEDRLTLAVFITYDKAGRPRKTEFGRAVIRSRKRLSYEQAQALLFENDFEKIRALPALPAHQTGSTGRPLDSLSDLEFVDLQSWLRKLWAIAKKQRAGRMADGCLDLDMAETKIHVDAKGYAERLVKVEHNESHQLIEEFMLAANEAVAHLTRTHRLHSLYRVHDEPDFKKLAEYREFASLLGVECGELTRREEVNRLLERAETHPQGHLLKSMFLRSLKKACYRATPDGHFGLNKKDYTHFTSPIRRYADLVVHRVLCHHLDGGAGAAGIPAPAARPALDALADHLSETEANSAEAERESQRIKMLEFFERELAKRPRTRFTAIITEVRSNGLFIELTESLAFGFVSIRTLRDDEYVRDANGRSLVGRRTHRRLTLGSRIEVWVTDVDRQRRQVDFAPAL